MAIVTFDPSEFRAIYPGYSDEVKYTDEYLSSYFDIATNFIPNTDTSFVPYDPEHNITIRATLLNYVTCHLLGLADLPNGQAGRVASASQGSVSTSFDLLSGKSNAAQWWMQTQCGAMAWQLMARYRLGGRIYTQSNFHPWG